MDTLQETENIGFVYSGRRFEISRYLLEGFLPSRGCCQNCVYYGQLPEDELPEGMSRFEICQYPSKVKIIFDGEWWNMCYLQDDLMAGEIENGTFDDFETGAESPE